MTETFDAKEYLQQGNWRDMKLGLRRMGVLLRNLGNPEQKMKFVHVAGTNGKGSTCAFISSILQEAGYKTGLFTSPYVLEFNERIQINGSNIPDSDLERLALQVKDKADFMPPSVPTSSGPASRAMKSCPAGAFSVPTAYWVMLCHMPPV